MRRDLLLPAALSALLLGACQKKNTPPASRLEEAYVPLERSESSPPAEAGAASASLQSPPPNAANEQAEQPGGEEELSPAAPAGGRTYVVQKGDTLCGLARRFYGDQARWKEIWEANQTRLRDPDKLAVGMKLIIP